LKIDPNQLNQDNNTITVGSDFMKKINQYIDFFIKRKLHEDPLWKDLEVFFSPSTVSGEGEHKIMDFI